ncbi:MAG TPA: permease [Candidatus Bilamarchaeum sp.]|nr:permease [Candidatus Bilamarchaeum sp.]
MFEEISAYVVYSLLGMPRGDPLSGALDFFIADSIKVSLLLAAMVFIVSIVRTFITPPRIRKMLGGGREGAGNVIAALLGIPTPFCSCSAVPLFIGLVEAGVPLGVTFSFLIASPMINEVALALLLSMFGWQVAALYIGSGLVIAVLAGIAIGRLSLEGEVEDFVYKVRSKDVAERVMGWKERFSFAKSETTDILARVGPFMLLGIAIGGFIHGYVPVGLLSEIAGPANPLAVPIAVAIGVPLYSNAAGTIPIIQALMSKGMAIGTALAFMMSVTALSLPEMIILRKVLKPKLLAAFAGILALSFVITGLLFNAVLA